MSITVTGYDKFWENVGKNLINLGTDTFRIILVNSYTFSAAHEDVADVSPSELTTANGYTSGGKIITSTTFSSLAGTTKFDGDDIIWTATGGNIGPTQGAVIYDDTADLLVCYIDFGGPETAMDDTDFKITFNTNGIFTII